jgi:restriction system protein
VFTQLRPSPLVAPIKPVKPNHPAEPKKSDLPKEPHPGEYAPQLSVLDHIFSSRRIRKMNQAETKLEEARAIWRAKASQQEREFEEARAKWIAECAAIEDSHHRLVASCEESHRANLLVYAARITEWEHAKEEHRANQKNINAQVKALREEYKAVDTSAAEYFFAEVLNHSTYPESFPKGSTLSFNQSSGVLIVDFELPNQSAFPAIKEVKYVATRKQFHEVPISDSWLKKTYDEVLYQITLRTFHELYIADESEVLKSIVFNGWVQSIDKATGIETHGCILSVQAEREEFLQINLSQVEPRACFRKLKGVASSKLTELTPIRPILTINKEDHRFVEGYAVADTLDDRTNLAAMDWLDFENLIRELFEEEFSKNGGEVKITQASRDGGVDAIAFDPDPIRGGKIVIQAKRYTNVVGVAAVRDLYGTVHNEGANKGILVTTATYGPDAYEFAKDKPLTLLSGGELLSLLATHGHRAKIDLQEAKALYLSQHN